MANRNPNTANLKPFKKGQDERRNMDGPPRKLPDLDTLMAEILGEEQKGGITAAQALLSTLYQKAIKGDIRASEVLLNRGYGLPTQKHVVSGDQEAPIRVVLDPKFKDE